MYKLNQNKVPFARNEIKKPFHEYPTKSREKCFSLEAISLKSTRYSFSLRVPKTWYKFPTKRRI